MLTPKQARFVDEYLIDLNATRAATAAGYSAKTAYATGAENLRKPEIARAIEVAQDERARRTEITADRVLQEFAKIGFGDIRRIFTADGSLKGPAEMDDETAATVASIEVVVRPSGMVDAEGNREVEHVHKIKAWDKIGALTQIGRHLGMFTDKTEHSGSIAILDREDHDL
jgi:phage terminase small subunit